MRPGLTLRHRGGYARRHRRLIGAALGVVTAAVLAIFLATGPTYAQEQPFDDAEVANLAVAPAATTDDAPEAPGPDESPADYLYAHYANAAEIDCLIAAESRWRDVPNARGTGAMGYGQYMPATWGRYQAESDRWDANPHDVYDVFAAIAWDLAHGRRAQWTVGGC
jgi:hypothetical protein